MDFLAAIDEEIRACRVELLLQAAAPASKTLEELLREQEADINTASNAQIPPVENIALASMRKRNKAIEALDPNWRTTILKRFKEAIAAQERAIEEMERKKKTKEAEKKNTSPTPPSRSDPIAEINRAIRELDSSINFANKRIVNIRGKVYYLKKLDLTPPKKQTPPKNPSDAKAPVKKTSRTTVQPSK